MSNKPTAGGVGFINGGIVDCVLADVRSPNEHIRGFIVLWLNANFSSFVSVQDAYAHCPAKVFAYYQQECARLRGDLEYRGFSIDHLEDQLHCERHCNERLRAETRRLKAHKEPSA